MCLQHAKWFSVLLCLVPFLLWGAAGKELNRVDYNNPGLKVDLGVGLWAWPLPIDFDRDGDLDLVVNCPDKPYNGLYFFENAGGPTREDPMPVFRPARRISRGLQNVQVSYVDGAPVIMTPGAEYPDFRETGLENPQELGLPANIHPNRVRANMWRFTDYEGDGDQDLIIGVGDWTDYGWDDAYSPSGEWVNGPLRGFVYLLIRKGEPTSSAKGGALGSRSYENPVKVTAAGEPVEVFGWPSPNFADFDSDGDLDLLCGEFLDGFTYFENIGTRSRPEYAAGVRLEDEKGAALTMTLQMITPTAIDWDEDGDVDLICGDEDGRVAFIEHTGETDPRGVPIFRSPRYFEQEADAVKFGALATPWGFDWDGDGDIDILSGNTAGYIGFIENLSGPGVERPAFAAPEYLRAGDQVIRIMAGPNGSIQGPAEAKWGYTTLSVADWDGDQLPDLIVNSIWGRVVWYRNVGSRTQPELAPAEPIEVEWEDVQPRLDYGWLRPQGKGLLTQWRTTPVAFDWNRDGLVDLVMLDHEGFLSFFERRREGEKLILASPRRIFRDVKGAALQLNAEKGGKSGRRKLCITDWDGDGRVDFLVNSDNAIFLRQIEGEEEWPRFEERGLIHPKRISGHTTSPTVVDWNDDGIPDALIGSEDGHFYYLRNPQSERSQAATGE